MIPTEAPLAVADAARVFGGDRGLKGVSLQVPAGCIYGLLGPNGAGKTTLIRAICGRLRLEGGQVTLLGKDPLSEPETRRWLGLVPQQIALYADLTVRENLLVFGRLAGLSRPEIGARVAWGLAFAELEQRADDRVSTLSGGMRRRLHLMAGVLHEPKVLLLDEPTVGVDPDARLRLHALLDSLRSQGMAILLTTHDLDEAAALSDRIGFLVDGRLRAEGAVKDLIAEAYGADRHLEILLHGEPDDAGRSHLATLDLQASRDPKRWIGRCRSGLEELASIEAGCQEAGLSVQELGLREAGLREVFLSLTGREFDA